MKEDAVIRDRGVVSSSNSLRRAEEFAKVALNQYGLQDAEFGLLRDGTKQLFCVSSTKGNFVLRTYNMPSTKIDDVFAKRNAELRSEGALHSQMLWLSALRHDAYLPVPEPILTLDGSLLGHATIEDVLIPCSFVLLRWIPGETKRGKLTLADVYLLGAHIAKMHNYAERYSAPENFVRPRWDWGNLFGKSSPLWSLGEAVFSNEQLQVLASTAEYIRVNLQAIGESRDQFGIIHGDLQPNNLVVHNGVIYIIDFDHCGYGYYLYDLATPYMHLKQAYKNCAEPMQAMLLEGYRNVRPLSSDHLGYLELFVSMRLLARFDKVLTSLQGVPISDITARPARLWNSHRLWEAMEILSAGLER